jgi:hypothetical protein
MPDAYQVVESGASDAEPSEVEPFRVDKMPSEAMTQMAVSANQISRRTQGCRMRTGEVA